MVVGADIEDGMILAVVPADEFIVLLDEREEARASVIKLLAFLHLSQEPRTGDDRMGFQELLRGRGRHLAGDDTREVTLYGKFVDGNNLIGLNHQSERAREHLVFLTLPVKIHTDGDIMKREGSIVALRDEG